MRCRRAMSLHETELERADVPASGPTSATAIRQTRWYYAIWWRWQTTTTTTDWRTDRLSVAASRRRRRLLRDGSISRDRLNLDGRRSKIIDVFAWGTLAHGRTIRTHMHTTTTAIDFVQLLCTSFCVSRSHRALCAMSRFITDTDVNMMCLRYRSSFYVVHFACKQSEWNKVYVCVAVGEQQWHCDHPSCILTPPERRRVTTWYTRIQAYTQTYVFENSGYSCFNGNQLNISC